MGVPGNANLLLLAGGGYQIERSLRFNSADSAYLNQTPASAGNRTTWTWSGWVKRATFGAAQQLFGSSIASNETTLYFTSSDTLQLYMAVSGSVVTNLITSQVFRDPSAFYHLVASVDTTQATASDRIRLYVNGVQITAFGTSTYCAQNTQGLVNSTNAHTIGRDQNTASVYLNGLLTEVHFIDGQALTPSSFGETDTITGVWKPKKYAGTYSGNSFYLKFADSSGTTSTTLGKDSSGLGNNWTPNNFSVTAGAGNDSMIDTPTPYADGGNGRGNYCTWNPLAAQASTYTARGNLVNGNLDCNDSGITYNLASFGTLALPSSGKWYFEVTPTAMGDQKLIGICNTVYDPTSDSSAYNTGYLYKQDGDKRILGTLSAYGATYTTNDVIGVAVDMDATPNASITFYKNGVSQGVASSSISKSSSYIPYVFSADNGTNSWVGNFGQRAFAYTPPSGFLALNTQNLPEPTIKKPSSYMDVVTYTGTGSALTPTSSLGFSPDLVWIKGRSGATDHALYDAIRGVEKRLESNNGDAEVASDGGVTAFNSAGFTLGTLAQVNTNTSTYAAWCWDESATPGFDIVTFTGTGAVQNISHSLGVAPSMMIVKPRNAAGSWAVYHTSIGANNILALNSTNASTAASTVWNNTAPTSSQFTVGSFFGNGETEVAYLWSEVAGFSKFGSYTGNGSTDGPFVHLGFRPRWVMTKRTDTTSNWMIMDAGRNPSNVADNQLYPNRSDAEAGASSSMDLTSNGFKLRNTGTDFNASSATYIFAAFSESAFKYSLAR